MSSHQTWTIRNGIIGPRERLNSWAKGNVQEGQMRQGRRLLQEIKCLFKFDLKSGYHHLDIFKPHQKYLGFAWETDGQQHFYVFTVLHFGLSTACYVFTKLMRPLIRYWRGRGLSDCTYVNDGIVEVKGKERAIQESRRIQSELLEVGLIVNNAKSHWVPTKNLT